MKIAYFDCQFGAAGDMLNAALLAAGVDQRRWLAELGKLSLPKGSFGVRVSQVVRCNIVAQKLDVLNDEGVKFDDVYERAVERPNHEHMQSEHQQMHAPAREHQHGHHQQHHHEHAHEHRHPHVHEHQPEDSQHQSGKEHEQRHSQHQNDNEHEHGTQGGQHAHNGHHHHRGLTEILALIADSGISAPAKDLASRIFRRLAAAESKVHGVKPEEVHFHEVGAVDAIVDIVGFAIGYDLAAIERAYCSAVAIGSGKARTEHGLFPIPGPATLYLLSEAGAKTAAGAIGFECLTPTGAAILCEIACQWGRQPDFQQITAVGYGAGTKDPDEWPNVCRVVIGESLGLAAGAHNQDASSAERFSTETIEVIEANIDDMNPQALSFAIERLLEAGALDAFIVPAVMKKGRAGQLLTVLCRTDDRDAMQSLIFKETTTIGVRFHRSRRAVALRDWVQVKLPCGTVRIKVARDKQGNVINAQPEFEDCARYARENDVPLKEVLALAMKLFDF